MGFWDNLIEDVTPELNCEGPTRRQKRKEKKGISGSRKSLSEGLKTRISGVRLVSAGSLGRTKAWS